MEGHVVIEDSVLEIKKSINLETIIIEGSAFQNFENFTLGENPEENEENFPKLKNIRFGTTGRSGSSSSFFSTDKPFVLANLPALENLIVGLDFFYSTNSVHIENLPKLQFFDVGARAFHGAVNSDLTIIKIGTEYYTLEDKKTRMRVSSNTFNSEINVYLKGNVFHLVLILDTPVAIEFDPYGNTAETEIAFNNLEKVYYTFSDECMYFLGLLEL